MKYFLTLIIVLTISTLNMSAEPVTEKNEPKASESAIFAGGCFWCVEEAFDNVPGVLTTTSGFTGGDLKNPTYEQVSHEKTGHYEALRVSFDPSIISYQKLLEIFWNNVDPIDAEGQFCDRGESYRSAIFYLDDQQKALALQSKADVEKKLKTTVATKVVPAVTFYPAEEYHQEYHKKNHIRYKTYRYLCGRDKRLNEVWGKQEKEVD